MKHFPIIRRMCVAAALLVLSTQLGRAQVGVITGPANSLLACFETVSADPALRPEGYTELLGDIVISCVGGPPLTPGTPVPVFNLVLYISPAPVTDNYNFLYFAPSNLPITSRIIGENNASEVMLTIDEPGSGLSTGAIGGYGPQAPQSLCTAAQQQSLPSPCQAYVSTDQSGQYPVAVLPGTSTPAPNVYQGKIGDYGVNSVTFYNVPELPPVDQGVSRVYRITNLRTAIPGGIVSFLIQGLISTNGPEALPVAGTVTNLGVVGPPMTASVNAAPAGGRGPFMACAPQTTPALAARLTYTEGFATAFKTRVVPGGAANSILHPPTASNPNYLYAAEAQNLAAPFNQNIPGGLYGGFANNSESGFIMPAANTIDGNVPFTAGLADYGTRLKAVFTNIPAGVTVYVSTANVASYPIAGGTNSAPYAALVAVGQVGGSIWDQTPFTPGTSAIVGSDGLYAFPLTPDNSGAVVATWEVLNADSGTQDQLTFSVYVAYASTPGTTNPTHVALSLAPEPGGGTFSAANGTQGLTFPEPRFAVLTPQGGPWATIDTCSLGITDTSTVSFNYSVGGSVPPVQSRAVAMSPANLAVTATPVVNTPTEGSWLTASVTGGKVNISTNPAGLTASATAYTGNVKLSAPGLNDVTVPVNLTVSTGTSTCQLTEASGLSGLQLMINEALGIAPPASDLNRDGVVNVADVQVQMNGLLSPACVQ